jgi:hypothetical protein
VKTSGGGTGTSTGTANNFLNQSNGTANFNFWSNPEMVDVNEFVDSIEMIYKQRKTLGTQGFMPDPQQERVFKIVFSCIDGKWNKSEPIYGNIILAKSETYEF